MSIRIENPAKNAQKGDILTGDLAQIVPQAIANTKKLRPLAYHAAGVIINQVLANQHANPVRPESTMTSKALAFAKFATVGNIQGIQARSLAKPVQLDITVTPAAFVKHARQACFPIPLVQQVPICARHVLQEHTPKRSLLQVRLRAKTVRSESYLAKAKRHVQIARLVRSTSNRHPRLVSFARQANIIQILIHAKGVLKDGTMGAQILLNRV